MAAKPKAERQGSERFYPTDRETRKQVINNNLEEVRTRWFQTDIAWQRTTKLYEKAVLKQLRGQRSNANAVDRTEAELKNQLANLEVQKESFEIEIDVLLAEREALGADPAPIEVPAEGQA